MQNLPYSSIMGLPLFVQRIADALTDSGILVHAIRRDMTVILSAAGKGGHRADFIVLDPAARTPDEAFRDSGIISHLLRAHIRPRPAVIVRDLWERHPEMMKERMLAHCGIFTPVFARNCEVRRISRPEADSFLEMTFPAYIDVGFTSKMEEGLDKIAGGSESKRQYLDSFWKGSDGFPGLDADLQKISQTVRKADVTTLTLPGLSGSFDHDGTKVSYAVKISKFGPYLASDCFDREAGKERMASIDQNRYFPGTFTDADAKRILFPENADVEIAEGISVSEGRFGKYLKTYGAWRRRRGIVCEDCDHLDARPSLSGYCCRYSIPLGAYRGTI